MHRGAGVTAPATARPFGRSSPCRSPTTGAARRTSREHGEPSCWRRELKPNGKETDPCPTHRDYSHSRVARDTGSGCLRAGRSLVGNPELAGAFLGASPGPAPLSGTGVLLLPPLGSARSTLPARAARWPRCVSKRAEEQLNTARYIATPRHAAARPASTNRSRVSRRPAMPSVQLSWRRDGRVPGVAARRKGVCRCGRIKR